MNVPILEYVLELLAASGVQEIFVFCCAHAQQIKNYIKKSDKWTNAQLGVEVRTIESQSATSAGDALRSVHEMDLIRNNDFVLIAGDVVSNIDLKPIIERHREARKKDPTLIMSSVFARKKTLTIPTSDSVTLSIAPETNTLLSYDSNLHLQERDSERKKNGKKPKPFSMSIEQMKKSGDVVLRSDLMDCHIDICSPAVLDVLNENFDFNDLRMDFLKGHILSEDEVTQWRVAPVIVSNSYSSRIRGFRSYDLVSKDIVRRWMYPVAPDTNFSYGTNFEFWRPNNYAESPVYLARSC